MREPALFVATRGRGWRDARRALARSFDVSVDGSSREARTYFDTFDWRLLRAGLQLDACHGVVSLRDATTAETVAEGRWSGAAAVRFARDLAPPTLRDRVAAVTEPRALLEAARVTVTVDDAVLRDARKRVVGRVRSEAAAVKGRDRSGTSRWVVVEVARGAARAGTADAVRRALSAAGYRAGQGSGYGRVLALVGARPADAVPKPRVVVDEHTPLRIAAAGVFRHLLRLMERNEWGIERDLDPEFLHDYRVALRRTRTALAEFGGVLAAARARALRARFADLARPTGPVRDLDVHLGRRGEYEAWVPEAFRAGLGPLFASLERRRAACRADLLATLASKEYAALKRDWKRALADLAAGERAGVSADEPALAAARAAAAKRFARLHEIATSSDALSDAALHRARVQGKRLRYVLEFFATPAANPLLVALVRAQDALGAHHDASVFLSMLDAEAREIPRDAGDAVVRGAALGALTARLEVRRDKMRRRGARRLAELTGKKNRRALRRALYTADTRSKS